MPSYTELDDLSLCFVMRQIVFIRVKFWYMSIEKQKEQYFSCF